MYDILGQEILYACMEEESPQHTEALIEWLPLFASDPVGRMIAVREREGRPLYVTRVAGTHTFVDYLVFEVPRVIVVLGAQTVPFFDD